MSAIDILGLLIPVTFFVFLGIEALWPARQFVAVKRWRLVGVAFLVLGFAIGTLAPMLLPVEWLDAHKLFDGTKLGVAGGAIVGFVVAELVIYAYHRAAHNVSFMWRWLHQMHHSAERLDMAGATVFHPFELIAQNVIAISVMVFVLGLHPLSAAIVGYLLNFYGLFQHLNVRTPKWLGIIIQRPEAHGIHHQYQVHAYNYADLPLWDLVFGTFRNPETFEGRVGFGEKASYGKMLVGRDVSGGMGANAEQSADRAPPALAA